MARSFPFQAVLAGLLLGAVPAFAADGFVITEFMADNTSSLLDSDGEASDWIEIENVGSARASLAGWYLTDSALDLRLWRFPAVLLEAGGFIVVFASGKDRPGPGELHTSFKLDLSGEYLALVRPDGRTVATEFSPAFPRQRPDVSFGEGRQMVGEALVAAGATGRVLVPRDASAGRRWTGIPSEEPFDDSAAAGWVEARTGIGYPASEGAAPAPAPIAYWSFDRTLADLAGNGHTASLVGASFADDTPPQLGGGQALSFDGVDDYASVAIDVSETSYTMSLWFKAETPNHGIFSVVDGDLGSGGYDRLLYLQGGEIAARVWNNETVVSNGKNLADRKWHHLAHTVGGAVGGQRVYIDGRLVASGSKALSDFDWQARINIGFTNDAASPHFDGLIDDVAIWDSALEEEHVEALAAGAPPLAISGYAPWIRTDVAAWMAGVNASAYLRIPFEAAAPAASASIVLRILYDDGFAAYLNGVEVARRNAPGVLAFDSAALSDRPSVLAIRAEDIDLGSGADLLRAGRNVLAIHALNDRADGSDFLLLPEVLPLELSAGRYLLPPTPGAPNGFGVRDFISETKFSEVRGLYSAPFSVTITTGTVGASIYTTTDGSKPSPDNPNAAQYSGPISITTTTTLRAAAFKEDHEPTNVETHTYIFTADVARQSARPPGLPTAWSGFPADYGVDPDVVNTAIEGYSFEDALLSLPSVSITAPVDDLFSQARGIYANPQGRGPAWERTASVELIESAGAGFQVDAGLRMHGNSSRDHSFTPKHPIRLLFQREHGAPKLEFPLFAGSRVDTFDHLLLRAASTDSWPVVEGGSVLGVQRWSARHATYHRDQWMRDAQLAMGNPSCHGTYVHLYLNGLYWGLYNLAERPVESFCAEHLGGKKEEYDVLKDFAELEAGDPTAWNAMLDLANAGLGTNAAYQKIQGNNPDGTRNPAFPVYLDVENLIDYMILHIYAGAEDWPHHNWWGARRRGPESKGFKFFVWDQEISNDSLVRTHTLFQTRFEDPVPSPSPSYLYGRLLANAAFRQKFIDRVHKHLFNDGTLTEERSAALWFARSAEIDRAMVAESARWGDSKRAAPYRREVEWLAEEDWMRDVYWPGIHAIAIERFRRVGVYPRTEAPRFLVEGAPRHGGLFAAGERLVMTVPSAPRFIPVTISGADSEVSAHVPVNGNLGAAWRLPSYVEGSNGEVWKRGRNGVGYDTGSDYESLLHIDLEAEMTGPAGNNTVYVRIPFTLEQVTIGSLDALTLETLHDDGFVAWLNGVKVAEANAPAGGLLTWSSNATAGTEAVPGSPTAFDISAFIGELRSGENVLAIQGLNFATSSSDMLLAAELHGGVLDETAPAGTVFYTLDGSDPSSPGALEHRAPVPLTRTVRVKARARDGDEWSALNEALFVLENAIPIRVTEVMYHPAPPPEGSEETSEELEFIELENMGSAPVDLTGVRIEGSIEFDFSGAGFTSLAAGGIVVVVEDLVAFGSRYDTREINIVGHYSGKLDNAGERILLKGPLGETLLDFEYDDAWYPTTDGAGDSLVIVDSSLPAALWKVKESWRASHAPGGSPGKRDLDDGVDRGWQLPGDSNRDGLLDLADAISLLFRLFGSSSAALPCAGTIEDEGNVAVLDSNGDNSVDITDAVHVLGYLFLSGPPPVRGASCVRLAGCLDACTLAP